MDINFDIGLNALVIALIAFVVDKATDIVRPIFPSLVKKGKDEEEETKRRSKIYALSSAIGLLASIVFIDLFISIFPFFFKVKSISGAWGTALGMIRGCLVTALLLGAGAGISNSLVKITEVAGNWKRIMEKTVPGKGIKNRRKEEPESVVDRRSEVKEKKEAT